MKVDERQILDVSRDLWTDILGLAVEQEAKDGERPRSERTLSSRVAVSGPWEGTIVVECPESIARHAAAMLFATDADCAEGADLTDALNELAEMVGRRVGSLLPEKPKVSRPRPIDAEAIAALGSGRLTELRLRCEGRPVSIKVFETEPVAEPA
jgi:hypothetical protein